MALGVLLALWGGGVALSRTGFVRERVERIASGATGYEVALARLGLDWKLDVFAEGLAIRVPGRDAFLLVASASTQGLPRALLADRSVGVLVRAPRFRLALWEPPPSRAGSTGSQLSLPPWIGGVDVRRGFVEGGGAAPVALGPIELTARSLEAGADLRLAGSSELPGRSGGLEWSARLAPDGRHLTVQAEAEVEGLGRLLRETGLAVTGASLAGGSASLELRLDGDVAAPLALEASGRVTLGGGGPPLALAGRGTLDLGGGPSKLRLEVRREGPERPLVVLGGELHFAEAALDAETTLADPAPRARLVLSSLDWADPEGTWTAAGARITADLAAAPPDPEEGYALRFDLRADAGELLVVGRYYLDLGASPVSLSGAARAIDGGVSLADGRIAVQGLGSATLSGRLAGLGSATPSGRSAGLGSATDGGAHARPDASPVMAAPTGLGSARQASAAPDGAPAASSLAAALDLAFELPDVAPAFAVAVRDPWQEAFPVLGGVAVGGALRGHLALRREASGALAAGGRIQWQRGRLSVASPEIRIDSVSLDLPLLLGTERSPEGADGRASLAGIAIGGVAVGALELPLRAARDRLSLAHPASFRVLEGELTLTELAASELREPSRALRLGLRADGLRLAPLTTAVGLPAFAGELDADLPRVRLAAGALETEGEIVLDAFGGTVRLERLRARDLGSGIATFLLDASFADLSLGALTEVFNFGKISGVVRGGVEGLEVQAGTPVRFRAWLESEPGAGVAQRISVDAIRKLSILGGSGGDPFSSGVLSFFDEYRYAKLGFRASLAGDRLRLEGVERHDGKEYLVVGAMWPPRVDVVSHTSSIAFSEMVRRLGRALESEGPRIE